MFRSLSRCRTGMFIVAGTLLAAGLTARETRELRAPNHANSLIQAPELSQELVSVDTQFELLYSRVKQQADTPQGLLEPFQAFREAVEDGRVDDAAIWATIANVSDLEVQAKLELVMRDFADRMIAGDTGIPLAEMPIEMRPPSLREIRIPDAVGGQRVKSLRGPVVLPGLPGEDPQVNACGSCASPGGTLAAPTTSNQFVSGNTCSCSPFSEFWNISLNAGTTYVFSLCTATCSGATGNYDSRIRVYNPSCAVLVDNDDFCGLLSQVTVTPTVTGVHKVEITGFTASNCGTYTMCYKSLPASSCGSCASPSGSITPTTTCQFVSGSNSTCPNSSTATSNSGGVWYNLNIPVGGVCYTFSTCPNNGAGSACFGTATFDTRLDIWNSTCTSVLASNDDASCSLIFRSALLWTPPAPGLYKLQVRGFSADTGTYTLAYQQCSGCTAPSIVSGTPTTGTTSSTNCSVTQAFNVSLGSLTTTSGLTGTYTITPPAGSSASPASGSIAFSGTNGTFTSTLTKSACGLANYTISVNVSNACGSASTSWVYQLRDATAPVVVSCPAGMTLDCAAPDPPAPARTATDNCDPAPTVTFAEARVAGSCPGNFSTVRTWTARDCNNNTGTCVQTIVHRDTTPPTLSGADMFCLWPPNHEYYCLQSSSLAPTLADDCSLPVSLVIVGCTSSEADEGTGDGDFPNDCIVSPDGKEVCIRSERSGSGTSRDYSVMGIAIDACGNRSAPAAVAIVNIPHDDSEHPECRTPNGGLDKHF